MNIDGCIKKIDKYLTKDNVQPCIVDVQTTADKSAVVCTSTMQGCTLSLVRYLSIFMMHPSIFIVNLLSFL